MALEAGSGGIRWNSTTNYIQLQSDDKETWINWKYFDPEASVALIPIMPSASYNGYSVSSNATTQSSYYPWDATNPASRKQWYSKGNPNAYWQIMFPFEVFVNYITIKSPTSDLTGEVYQQQSPFTFSGSNDGLTFTAISPTLMTVLGDDVTTTYRLLDRYNYDTYIYYRLQFAAYTHTSSITGVGFEQIQFYGHSVE